MPEINHNIDLESHLAQAAKPVEVEVEQVEAVNDPAKSLNRGLITLYDKYLSDIHRQRQAGLIDREKANELAKSVLSLIERDGLRNEIGYTSPEEALEIMGTESYFGPNEVMEAGIGIKEEIPAIPFNPEELERAKELGQMLIYRTNTTMKELNDTTSLLDPDNFYQNKDYFKRDKIQPGWVLVSKELTPGSTGKNHLEQSELLVEHLVNEVIKGKPLPREYQEAIDEFNDQKEAIRQLLDVENEWEESSARLVNLKINQLFRQSPAEVYYDFIVYHQNTGERLHEHDIVWTSSESSDGFLAAVGKFDINSATVNGYLPRGTRSSLGVSFCRRGANLKS